MTQFKGISGGRLNVAVISAGDYFFPRLLVAFIGRHDGVVLNFTVHNREGLLAHLHDNLTDLAVMVRPPKDANLVSEPFAPHPYVIVSPPGHPLSGMRNIPIEQVCREPFVVREKGSDTWQSMQEAFGEHLARLNIAIEIKSTETIKQAVMAGMGLGFLSAHTIVQERRNGSLEVLDVEGFPLMLNWYVVHQRSKRLPPVAQAFKEFLLNESAALIAGLMAVPAPSPVGPTQMGPADPPAVSRVGRPSSRRGGKMADARASLSTHGASRNVRGPRRATPHPKAGD
jgi:DNA-binding transcriptional LysR family regulator